MAVGGEQSLVRDQGRLDLGIARQDRRVGDTEAIRRLSGAACTIPIIGLTANALECDRDYQRGPGVPLPFIRRKVLEQGQV